MVVLCQPSTLAKVHPKTHQLLCVHIYSKNLSYRSHQELGRIVQLSPKENCKVKKRQRRDK